MGPFASSFARKVLGDKLIKKIILIYCLLHKKLEMF